MPSFTLPFIVHLYPVRVRQHQCECYKKLAQVGNLTIFAAFLGSLRLKSSATATQKTTN
ncbi:flavodoxin, partial [Vibrio parahaemolyticus]